MAIAYHSASGNQPKFEYLLKAFTDRYFKYLIE